MSAIAAISRTWNVGEFTCTLSLSRPSPGHPPSACCDWEPATPERLTAAEMAEYRKGRNLAVLALSAELGISTLVVDL
jgi:hypothetical protein